MFVVRETSKMQLIVANIGLISIYSYKTYKIVLKNVYYNSNYSDFISNYGNVFVMFMLMWACSKKMKPLCDIEGQK